MDWFEKILWSLGWELLNLTIIVDNSPLWVFAYVMGFINGFLYGVLKSIACRRFYLKDEIRMWVLMRVDC